MGYLFGRIVIFLILAWIIFRFFKKTQRWIQFRRGELKPVWATTTARVLEHKQVTGGYDVRMAYTAEGRDFTVDGTIGPEPSAPTTIPLIYLIGKPETWEFAEDRPIGAEEFEVIRGVWLWIVILGLTAIGVYAYLVNTEGAFKFLYLK